MFIKLAETCVWLAISVISIGRSEFCLHMNLLVFGTPRKNQSDSCIAILLFSFSVCDNISETEKKNYCERFSSNQDIEKVCCSFLFVIESVYIIGNVVFVVS